MYIGKFLRFCYLVLLLCVTRLESAAMPLVDNVPQPPASCDQQVISLIDEYKRLVLEYSDLQNLPKIDENATLLDAFCEHLIAPRNPNALPNLADSRILLGALYTMYQNIKTFSLQNTSQAFSEYFRKVLAIIADRYYLARIENQVVDNKGFIGERVYHGIPNGPSANPEIFRRTINHLLGRIFVVKNTREGPIIAVTSSGMILPCEGHYDTIITCCHSLALHDVSPDLEFYFVRAESLNPKTGLPLPERIAAALSVPVAEIDTKKFIEYLRQESNDTAHNNNVRRIASFRATGRSQVSSLENHIPRHFHHEDSGYGFFLAAEGFHHPGVPLAEINILRQPSAETYDYYAIGYPSFSYYDATEEDLLVQQQRFAPLVMTKSQSALKYSTDRPVFPGETILTLTPNGTLRHDAAVMKGMSGGPLLRFNISTNTIEVLGILTSIQVAANYACILK